MKRWCDRGIIPTFRTSGGHRRISLEALQSFLSESERRLEDPGVLGLPDLIRSRSPSIPGSKHPDQKRFREALAAGDEPTCRAIVQQRKQEGLSAFEVAEHLITDAMSGIGEAWQHDLVDVYQERVGCSICSRLINELSADIPEPAAGAPIAIGGAPSGDPYELPTMMVALALRESGWRAISLGSNIPMRSFIQAAHDYEAALVWMSLSVIDNASLFIAAQNDLANSLDDDVVLVVGGRGLCDQTRPKLLYTAHCDSLHHLVEFATVMRSQVNR